MRQRTYTVSYTEEWSGIVHHDKGYTLQAAERVAAACRRLNYVNVHIIPSGFTR